MTHPTRAFSGSIINRFTGSKILARVGQISVAFPTLKETIEANYRKVKQEIRSLVDSEIQRIKHTPSLAHLVKD